MRQATNIAPFCGQSCLVVKRDYSRPDGFQAILVSAVIVLHLCRKQRGVSMVIHSTTERSTLLLALRAALHP